MNAQEAVNILNKASHRNHNQWHFEVLYKGFANEAKMILPVNGKRFIGMGFNEFEAIAIAEAYHKINKYNEYSA